jgi:hypothetical protein
MVAKLLTTRFRYARLLMMGIFSLSSAVNAADLYFYDAGVKKPLLIDANQWASSSEASTKSSVSIRSLTSSEKSLVGSMSSNQERAQTKTMKGSPIFKTDAGGVPMGLPGGVILMPKQSDSQLEKKLSTQGLTVERAIGNTGALLIKSSEGLSSLELANRLHETGEFEHVTPNWWRERRKK